MAEPNTCIASTPASWHRTLQMQTWRDQKIAPPKTADNAAHNNRVTPPLPNTAAFNDYQNEWAKADQINWEADLGILTNTH